MAYARLKSLPVVVAEAIKSFSGEIPEEAQELLKNIVSDILPISDISKEKIMNVKQKIYGLELENLSAEESRVLQSLIKRLLKHIRSNFIPSLSLLFFLAICLR